MSEPTSARLIILGAKGGPRVSPHRTNPSAVLVTGDGVTVIDCGYGVSRAMVEAGVQQHAIRRIFLTHHHSDHNLEYGNLVNSAWTIGLTTPIHAFGPKGLEEMTRDYWRLNRIDVEVRMEDERKPDPRPLLIARDIDAGLVLDTPSMRVTAMRTPHPPFVENFAYRFETEAGVVVFSSDTVFNPAVAEFAAGADVLVHEAMYLPAVDRLAARVPSATRLKEHLLASHTTTDDVGRIAALARPRLLVLNHLVPGDDPTITDEMWLEGVRRHHDGPARVAFDGMVIDLPLD
jgi:ribonuclease BN (tRNA processing enzyme)